jgi:hypothetical protein
VPLTGTNLTILPLTLAIGWWLWKRKTAGSSRFSCWSSR